MTATRIRIQTVGPRDHTFDGHPLPEERCPQTGKRRYASEGSALIHAERFGFTDARAYPCPYCPDWHLTRQPKEHDRG